MLTRIYDWAQECSDSSSDFAVSPSSTGKDEFAAQSHSQNTADHSSIAISFSIAASMIPPVGLSQ